MRTANPALNDAVFRAPAFTFSETSTQTMTLEGTVWKTGLLLFLLVLGASFAWSQVLVEAPALGGVGVSLARARMFSLIGGLAAFAVAIVVSMRPMLAQYLAAVYAVAEGVALGAISAWTESRLGQGIVLQAVGLTFATMAALLAAYATRVIQPTEKFKLGVGAATGGICLMYLASFVLGIFGVRIPFLHDGGPIGIAVSLFIVGVAALNLVLDFDFVETGCRQGAPKAMEWYGAFGLLVTLAWLYIEMLRLLAKLRDR